MKKTRVFVDIHNIYKTLDSYRRGNADFCANPVDVRMDKLTDVWENACEHWPTKGHGKQEIRMDRNLHSIHPVFTLLCKGPDAKANCVDDHDDIIRMNNGALIGLAPNY